MPRTAARRAPSTRGISDDNRIAELFLAEVQEDMERYHRRIVRCLGLLTEKQLWWRPNPASNSAGNLLLHLSGNIRQWVVSGLGGARDVRGRDKEFSERGPISRRVLEKTLYECVRDACRVLRKLSPQALERQYTIQGFRVTGLAAVAHVFFHFSYHAGQIVYLTKLQQGRDLRLTKLPRVAKKK